MNRIPAIAHMFHRYAYLMRVVFTIGLFFIFGLSTSTLPVLAQQDGDNITYEAEKHAAGGNIETGVDYHYAAPETGVRAANIGAVVASDDFNRANLDQTRWSFVNPLGDGQVKMVGAGTGDAYLELTVPAGVSHDPWNVNRSVRVMAPASNGDFSVIVKFGSIPSQRYQMQGLIVEQDADNWLRLEIQHDGSSLRLLGISTVGGSSSVKQTANLSSGAAAYLQVTRIGDTWTIDYGTDGTTWPTQLSFNQALTVTAIGPYAANHASGNNTPPAFAARVDYLSDSAAPVVDEDALAETDTWAPFYHARAQENTTTSFSVTWYTDEPSTGRIEYGTTSSYGGQVQNGGGLYVHSLEVSNLTAGETYHYRLVAEDAGGRSAVSDDFTVTLTPDGRGAGPTIEIWYGDRQSFGHLGVAQNWINVLGNVADVNGVKSLTYQLNNQPSVGLSIGPDGRRLQNAGDFNVDLKPTDLSAGENTLLLTAVDNFNNVTTKTVTIDYVSGKVWPSPYSVNWSMLGDSTELNEVAHVIDGKWTIDNGNLRTAEPGYDRLIGLGDVEWDDYEVLVPITLHGTLSGGRGVGMILRWTGHTDVPRVCAQPKCGWQPLGVLAWYTGSRLQLYSYDPAQCDDGLCVNILDETSRSLALSRRYWFKARVETVGGLGVYSFKVWDANLAEPSGWDVSGTALADALARGSAVLLSHRYDASFGAVQITPLGGPPNQLPTAVDDQGTVGRGGTVLLNVTSNDDDDDGTLDLSSVTVVTQPTHGTVTVNPVNGRITYVHDGGTDVQDTFTYLVSDDKGAASNLATVTVTIEMSADTVAPVITLIGANPLQVEAGVPFVDPGATAVDDVDGNITAQIVVGGDPINVGRIGEYRITYNVSDSSGNAAAAVERTVYVVDTTAPIITVLGPDPLTHEAGTLYVDPGATAADSLDGDLTNQIPRGGDTIDSQTVGVYVVTYDVSDRSGNVAARRTRTVNVVDTTPPTISLIGDNPLVLEAGTNYQDPGVVITDQVDGNLTASVVIGGDSIDRNVPRDYRVTYEVQDKSGNRSIVARIVRVVDTTAPTLTLLGNNPIVLAYGQDFADPGVAAFDTVDGNLGDQVVISGDAVDSSRAGIYVVVYDVKDAAGNSAPSVRRTVRVLAPDERLTEQVYLPFVVRP